MEPGPAASRGVCGSNNLCVAATAEEPVTREESEESCSSGQVWKAAHRKCCPADRPRVKTDSVTGNKSCVACTVNEHCQNTGEICPHGGIGGQLCGARPAASRGVCGSNNLCVAATAEEPVTREESEESCSSGQVWKAAHRKCCPADRPRVKTDSLGNKSCVACTVNEHCQYNGEICYRSTGPLAKTCGDPTKKPCWSVQSK